MRSGGVCLFSIILYVFLTFMKRTQPILAVNQADMIRLRTNFFGEQIDLPGPILEKNGFLLSDEQGVSGYFLMVPYSPFAFPKPCFPQDWRPRSNYAHIVALGDERPGNVLRLVSGITHAIDLRHYQFPLVITSFGNSAQGRRLLDLLGFSRVDGNHYAVQVHSLNDLIAHGKQSVMEQIRHRATMRKTVPPTTMDYPSGHADD